MVEEGRIKQRLDKAERGGELFGELSEEIFLAGEEAARAEIDEFVFSKTTHLDVAVVRWKKSNTAGDVFDDEAVSLFANFDYLFHRLLDEIAGQALDEKGSGVV